MRYLQRLRYLAEQARTRLVMPVLLLLLLNSVAANWLLQSLWVTSQQAVLTRQGTAQAPAPFMHYPYYGGKKLQDRVNSYFDHDKPWYASDYIFVRYDGKRWSGSGDSGFNCDSGSNCFDGHDGYDLDIRFEPVLSS